MIQKVAIYIRVSTLDQARNGYSLAAQRKTLEDYATLHGYEVVHVYADEGISGKDISHRPAVREMLEEIKEGGIDIILVWALSRLTRSVADLYKILELLQRHNVSLVSHTEAFNTTTPMGRAMIGFLGIFAQMEREITAERVRTAMAERAAQGKRTAHEVLGYDLDGADGLKINEAEAERVRYIFDRYLKYHNLSAVAELSRLKGYTGKRGRTFRAEHIKTILTRPIYIGYNSYCGQLFQGSHPPIIDNPTWDRVQRLIKQPKRIGRPNKKEEA